MTATVTLDTTGYDYYGSDTSFRTSIKAGLAGIGVTTGQIEYDSGAQVICKISNGSGTYADNFIRFERNGQSTSRHSIQMGTGYSSGSEVTGAGTEVAAFYDNTSGNQHNHRYIKADDGTFGVVQLVNNSTNLVEGCYGFIKPTNTTQTAADIPLVMGIGSVYGLSAQSGATSASLGSVLKYWNTATNTYVSINAHGNMRFHFSDTKKGTQSDAALGSSHMTWGGTNSSSATYFGYSCHSVNFGLHNNIDGSLPIVPNVPVLSGDVPIGYNSNLVFCPPNLNPGDNIIITAGSEEYTVISNDGIAIRRV